MSAAISGHGYREAMIIEPRCKCGWRGATYNDPEKARKAFERHKTSLRHARGERGPLRLVAS